MCAFLPVRKLAGFCRLEDIMPDQKIAADTATLSIGDLAGLTLTLTEGEESKTGHFTNEKDALDWAEKNIDGELVLQASTYNVVKQETAPQPVDTASVQADTLGSLAADENVDPSTIITASDTAALSAS